MIDMLTTLAPLLSSHLPELMLISFACLMVSGFPVSFLLGSVTLAFAWIAVQNNQISMDVLSQIPGRLIHDVLLDQTLLHIPIILFIAELLVVTGQMERASKAVKGFFDPDILMPKQTAKRRRQAQIRIAKNKPEVEVDRSFMMRMFLPASLLVILIAYQFELPPELMTLALLVPAALLFCLYMFNWLAALWTDAYRFSTAQKAELTDPIEPSPNRPWAYRFKLIVYALPPILAVVCALVMLVVFGYGLYPIFMVLSMLIALTALTQGHLKISKVIRISGRAGFASANIGAMLMAGYCFVDLFKRLGGADKLAMLANEWIPSGPTQWLPLLTILLLIVALGLILDWLIMVTLVLPLLIPFFAALEFHSQLQPLWTGPDAFVSAGDNLAFNTLLSQNVSVVERAWLGVLVWLSLFTAIVTYCRQNGEIVGKRLASSPPNGEENAVSMTQLFVLQILGFTATIIIPATAIWLPGWTLG